MRKLSTVESDKKYNPMFEGGKALVWIAMHECVSA